MATKIEGWANGNPVYPGRHHSFTDLNSGIGVKATLVIGDERVFTESEVRALLKEVGSQKGIWIVDVQRVAERHGLASPSNPL